MFGLRGLRPDREISGFETAFAEIAPRLAKRGHDITIYCRSAAHSPERRPRTEDGITLHYMPSPGGKNFSAVTSTGLAVAHAFSRRRFDVWFFVNVGMGHHAALARASGRPVVMNVDGLDWRRGKWGPAARAYVTSAARSAVRHCTALVTDAEAMRQYYLEHFGRDSTMIPYGTRIERSEQPEMVRRFGVRPDEYFLIVSRLIPENSLEAMLGGFRRSRTKRRLIVVGGATYRNAFHERLEHIVAGDERMQLVGAIYDQTLLKELWCNCYAYMHGHSVGGTNPALLRSMGYGSCVLARDTIFNREVLEDAGRYFAHDADSVAALIDELDADESHADALRRRAVARAEDRYAWEPIVDAYENLFRSVVSKS
ncbi:MAG TPA: glycosyltransferase [Gemmatimonadaceae bacterium]|jgi:glycosyltransferase involved in cell wall biosynthesis|nr:glycosyltransferase [Gemmatimonadaceae bacterium]